jgi:hypothetical protein
LETGFFGRFYANSSAPAGVNLSGVFGFFGFNPLSKVEG